MSSNYTGSSTSYPATVAVPADGDAMSANSVAIGMEELADQNGFTHVGNLLFLADIAALRAVDVSTVPLSRHVKNQGWYIYDSTATGTEDLPFKVTPNAGSGRWLLSTTSTQARETQIVESSGTWTCPSGVTAVGLLLCGAGGAGAGSGISGTADSLAGMGGGGGARGECVYRRVAVVPGTDYAFIIGAGGTGGSGDGGAGGDTQFCQSDVTTVLASARGGGGGRREGVSQSRPFVVWGGVCPANQTMLNSGTPSFSPSGLQIALPPGFGGWGSSLNGFAGSESSGDQVVSGSGIVSNGRYTPGAGGAAGADTAAPKLGGGGGGGGAAGFGGPGGAGGAGGASAAGTGADGHAGVAANANTGAGGGGAGAPGAGGVGAGAAKNGGNGGSGFAIITYVR